MYEEYLTKSLSDLVLARQAICNYESNKGLKDMKNLASYHVQQAIEKMLNEVVLKVVSKGKGCRKPPFHAGFKVE